MVKGAMRGVSFRFNLWVIFSRETHASVVKDRKGFCSVTESLYLFSCSVIRSWLLLGAGMSSEGAGPELFSLQLSYLW